MHPPIVVFPALKAPLADAVAKWRTTSRAALRRRGFRLTGAFPLSGRLTLKVFTVPRTAAASARRLIASGSVTVPVAETVKLTARTTRARAAPSETAAATPPAGSAQVSRAGRPQLELERGLRLPR